MNIERQYIGARYVPILGGAWDRNKSYEAMTIVQANNNSYTSKKPVPPGVDITNSEYWVITGNFNGQVEEYRKSVENLSRNVELLNEEVENMATKKQRFIFIGDSYAGGWNPEEQTNIKSWVEYAIEYLGLESNQHYKKFAGGAGFSKEGQTGVKFIGLLEELHAEIEEPELITDIVVLGGYNDYSVYNNIPSDIKAFSARAKTLFPNSTFRIGFIGRSCKATTQEVINGLYNAFDRYSRTMDASYLRNIQYSCRDMDMFYNDGIHPNATGQAAIGKALSDCIKYGSANCFSLLKGVDLDNSYGLIPNCFMSNDTTTLYFPLKYINFETALNGNLNGDIVVDFGEVKSSTLSHIIYGAQFRVDGVVRSNTGFIPAELLFTVDERNHLVCMPYATTSEGWAAGLNQLNIYPTTVQIPTIWC